MRNYILLLILAFSSLSFITKEYPNIEGSWTAECLWSSELATEEANICRLCPLISNEETGEAFIDKLKLEFVNCTSDLAIGKNRNEIVSYKYKRGCLKFKSKNIEYQFKVSRVFVDESSPKTLKLTTKQDHIVSLTLNK